MIRDIFLLIQFLRRFAKTSLASEISREFGLLSPILISFIFAPIKTFISLFRKDKNIAKSIVSLGPIFIKFGQSLSTRSDLVGEKIANLLKDLQDKIDPFDSKILTEILEQELGQKKEEIFSEFSLNSTAAASIAQVHKARLKDGGFVAVKVLRPEIDKIYEKDIRLLYLLARLGNIFLKDYKRLRLVEAVKIFEDTMKFELDLRNEAAAASQLKDNLKNDEDIVIPAIYWDFTTSKILVSEWIDGISIYEEDLSSKIESDKSEIAKKIAISFLSQAFRDGFFHADLHPGNILVLKSGKIAFVDFGIIGKLSNQDRLGLAEVLYCIFSKDFIRVAEIHLELGYIPANTNIGDFALACRAVTEPIIGKPIDKVSIGRLLDSLFKMTANFGMITQPQLILLQKTIVVVEGIGKIMAPELNMWNLAEPWIEEWAIKNLTIDAKILKILRLLVKDIKSKLQKI